MKYWTEFTRVMNNEVRITGWWLYVVSNGSLLVGVALGIWIGINW